VTDDVLRIAFDVGQARWPAIAGLTFEQFRAHAELAAVDHEGLGDHAGDLFLAAAAAAGDSKAIAVFDQEVLSDVPRWLARFRIEPDDVDEIQQVLRLKLLVGSPPKLAGYRASGPLGAWVRMAAVRAAIDHRSTDTVPLPEPSRPGTVALLDSVDPERQLVRSKYGPAFERAVADAIGRLPRRDRTLLRLHYSAKMSLDAMARTYHVHRVTVVRWLVAAREEVEGAISEILWRELGVSPSEFRSLWHELKSDVEISVSRILA